MTDLLELAARCEAATGPDRELDFAIYAGLNPDKDCSTIKASQRYLYGENYTGSVEAAMLLIPDNFRIRDLTDWNDGSWSLELRRRDRKHHAVDAEAKSTALALCAAALRARTPK